MGNSVKKIIVFPCFSKRFCFLCLEKRSLVNSENVENPLVFTVYNWGRAFSSSSVLQMSF